MRSIVRYKCGLCIMLAIVIFMCSLLGGANETNVYADDCSYIVIEKNSGRILDGNNYSARRPIASTTKVLTAITVLENIQNADMLDKVYEVPTESVGVEGSSIYLQKGERVSIRELLYGLMLRSGNDSAVALAVITAGSVENFASRMNRLASEIGCLNSNFVNPHGLTDENHYSTAKDLAMISAYAMKNALFCQIVGTKKYEGMRGSYVNKNKILTECEGGNGIKTGYTKVAGKCLVSSALRDGMQVICVVLNCPNMWEKSKALLDSAFCNYEMKEIYKRGEISAVSVGGVLGLKARLAVNENVGVPVRKGGNESVEVVTDIPKCLNFPIKKGQVCGKVSIYIGKDLIFSEKVYSMDKVTYMDVFK